MGFCFVFSPIGRQCDHFISKEGYSNTRNRVAKYCYWIFPTQGLITISVTCYYILSNTQFMVLSRKKAFEQQKQQNFKLRHYKMVLDQQKPLASGQGVRLLPYVGNCKLFCYEHWGTCVFSNQCFCFLWLYTGVEMLDHMVVLLLIFQGTSILFSTVAAPIYIPTNSVRGFPFFHILANICYLQTFFFFKVKLFLVFNSKISLLGALQESGEIGRAHV